MSSASLHSVAGARAIGSRRFVTTWAVAGALGMALFFARAQAHPGAVTCAVATVERENRVEVVLSFDVLAWALNDTPDRIDPKATAALLAEPPGALDGALARAEKRLRRGLRLWADDTAVEIQSLAVPTASEVRKATAGNQGPVMLSAVASFPLPTGTRTITLLFPEVIGPVTLLTNRPGAVPVTEDLSPGTRSRVLAIR